MPMGGQCATAQRPQLHLAAAVRRQWQRYPVPHHAAQQSLLRRAPQRQRRKGAPPPQASLLAVGQRVALVAAVAPAALATATSAAASVVDLSVLAATMNASGKLFLICAVVGWLLKSKRIPNSTATVLSQVSFQLLIPCMLFSKVASTLAAQPDLGLLAGIAAVALMQICVGAAFGVLLAPLVEGRGAGKRRQLLGWHPLRPARSASAIAASTAAATGVPLVVRALLPRTRQEPKGAREMVAAACAFGNSFTLPAVFFMTLLPAPVADRALGYAALFLLAWSPCLWSIGLGLMGRGGEGGGSPMRAQQQVQPPRAIVRLPQQRQQLQLAQPPQQGQQQQEEGEEEESAAEGQEAWWEPLQRLLGHRRWRALQRFAAQVLNPPFLAIVCGMLVGLTPAGRRLLVTTRGGAAAAAAAGGSMALPLELGMAQAAFKAALEVVELLAAGTLAIQTLVLAASLLQRPESAASRTRAGPAAAAVEAAAAWRPRGMLAAAAAALLPSDAAEARALAVLATVRFVLLPMTTILGLQSLAAWGLLPPAMSDPLLLFVLLVQSCMPSAQNLIILLQLSPSTQAAAPAFARMLLKLYAYAVLPVTLYVTAFASSLGIPVLR